MLAHPHWRTAPYIFTLIALTALCARSAQAQRQAARNASAVEQAAFNRAALRDAGQTVRFSRRPVKVGDEIEQAITLQMRLATTLRQANELAEKGQTSLRAQQRRIITTTEVEAGRTTAARVRYLEATKNISAGKEPAADSSEPGLAAQPVAGKTYLCRREAGPQGKLIVTDENGNIPPLEEYQVVAEHMDTLGRPNPLAEFLAGRTIAIGETIALPKESAETIFNLGDQFGEVVRFDLTLERTEQNRGVACAVFLAQVEAASSGASQMRLELQGPFVVQIDTCRAAEVDLSGPIGMSETRGSYSTAYQLIGTGQLRMSVVSAYRDARP